jgi:hypothetical protein
MVSLRSPQLFRFVLAFLCIGLNGLVDGMMASPRAATPPFTDMHLGLFAHYTYVGKSYPWGWTQWADGTPARSLDDLADHLDVEDFASTAASMRAQYVMFTTFQTCVHLLAINCGVPCSARSVAVTVGFATSTSVNTS